MTLGPLAMRALAAMPTVGNFRGPRERGMTVDFLQKVTRGMSPKGLPARASSPSSPVGFYTESHEILGANRAGLLGAQCFCSLGKATPSIVASIRRPFTHRILRPTTANTFPVASLSCAGPSDDRSPQNPAMAHAHRRNRNVNYFCGRLHILLPFWLIFFWFDIHESMTCALAPSMSSSGACDDAAPSTQELIKEQLGYLPSNFVCVSARNEKGIPIAIQTYPLQGGARRRQFKASRGVENAPIHSPFPTLYWLTCPEISRCVAELERRGTLQEFEIKIQSDKEMAERLWQCHREYGEERWNALSEEDRALLKNSEERAFVRMRGMMQNSGISGSNLTVAKGYDSVLYGVPAIKCLHAHYAHYRSTREKEGCQSNPVGELIHEQLIQEFPDLQL